MNSFSLQCRFRYCTKSFFYLLKNKFFFINLDKILNEAAKILRLIHIKELRDFQTSINETIVTVQSITANPKTDLSLGRVGK